MPSSLKEPNLNSAGDSLIDAHWALFLDRGLLYGVMFSVPIVFAAMEWLRWYLNILPSPFLCTGFAIVVSGFAAWRMWKLQPKIANLRLGIQGERAVAAYLEELREDGAKVFHDIPGNGFNIDHVVVHSTGVYVIETKMISKRGKGQEKVRWDGESITVGGRTPDRDPIQQVRSARRWLAEIVKKSTGKHVQFREVILYPEWFVERVHRQRPNDLWVLNPKALRTYISNSSPVISDDDVRLVAFHLDRFIRAEVSRA